MSNPLRNFVKHFWQRWSGQIDEAPTSALPVVEPSAESDVASAKPQAAGDVQSLVEQMLAGGRYALLLRPQIAQNLTVELYGKAKQALEREMGLVPQGDVHLEPSVFDIDYALLAADHPD